jgi:phage head maturation protease
MRGQAKGEGKLQYIADLDIHEVSVCSFPMNEQARITHVEGTATDHAKKIRPPRRRYDADADSAPDLTRLERLLERRQRFYEQLEEVA